MIGIILLNYNSWEELATCINSIQENSIDAEYKVYIVDNASTIRPSKKTLEMLHEKNCVLIECPENNGYSAGNNVGIIRALKENCSHILISNTDVIFHSRSIDYLVEYLLGNLNVGIVGPRILDSFGQVQPPGRFYKTDLKVKYLVNTPLRRIFPRKFKSYFGLDQDKENVLEVHAVSGCCFMMSRECCEMITPFDERTFLYEEELIIGIRMSNNNLLTHYIPASTITHAEGQTTKVIKAFSYKCFVESEIYYCKRYLNANIVSILPLYIIRFIGYLYRIHSNDFKKNFKIFLASTFKLLWKKI